MDNQVPDIILFVKAGVDGKKYGACPFCQRIFMILLVKAQMGKIKFKVATVNLVKPPEQFKKLGLRRLPSIVCGEESFEIVDDIIQFLDDTFPGGGLLHHEAEADAAIKDVFSKFCFFIKEVSKDSKQMEMKLKILDEFLSNNQSKFLCADHITHLDMEVLPKLQHMRIACKALKNYEFPASFEHLWSYLRNAYHNECFVKTCPSDQEIILHWADKPDTPNLTLDQYKMLGKASPIFTLTVPSENV